MNISAKTEYACLAVLELATQHESGRPIRIKEIAEKHGVPSRFLVQILLQLKGAGLVESVRGAAGGYRLRKSPQEISLGEVMEVIDGQRAKVTTNAAHRTSAVQCLQRTWHHVSDVKRELLNDKTFADLVSELEDSEENMYYI